MSDVSPEIVQIYLDALNGYIEAGYELTEHERKEFDKIIESGIANNQKVS